MTVGEPVDTVVDAAAVRLQGPEATVAVSETLKVDGNWLLLARVQVTVVFELNGTVCVVCVKAEVGQARQYMLKHEPGVSTKCWSRRSFCHVFNPSDLVSDAVQLA